MFARREMPIGQVKPQFGPSLIFSIMLLVLGGSITWAGWDAIGHRHYEMGWTSSGTFGASNGVMILEGIDAVRFGVGLMSFGIMMATWGVGIVVWFARQYSPSFITRTLSGLKWFSFVCLFSAITCIFPPWEMTSISFWSVVVLILVVVFALPNSARKRWIAGLFIGLICAAIVISSVNTKAGTGIAIGIFVSLVILVHVFLLFARLEKSLLLDENAE